MNTFRDLGAETGDTELETSLGHIMRPCLKKKINKRVEWPRCLVLGILGRFIQNFVDYVSTICLRTSIPFE